MSQPRESPTRFGSYELVRYLAAGGMADLYLARSPRFPDRDLVIKRIQARYLDHTRVVKMFIDEGRIAKLLEHPNVVRVVDVGSEDGAWYIAMEYIHGHDLVAIGRRAVESNMPMPRPVAVGIGLQIAAGLDYAHTRKDEKGRPLRIVHCDVSPGNVVIAFRGAAKIVDFGIARATIAMREEDGVAGKYNYMAPEQIRGERVDERADLFSLGVILWELTVGKRLFRGRPEQVMRKVLDEPIPHPEEARPGYPPALAKIVMRLLARDREERQSSAAALCAELKAYVAREEVGYGKGEIAKYLRALFDAPHQEITDPTVIVDDVDVDRGMPETNDGEISEPPGEPAVQESAAAGDEALAPGDGPTAAIFLPEARSQRERRAAEAKGRPDQADQAGPSRRRSDRRADRVRPLNDRTPPPQGPDPTTLVRMPGPNERPYVFKPRRAVQLSSGVVVGGCMLVLAVLLVVAYFAVGR